MHAYFIVFTFIIRKIEILVFPNLKKFMVCFRCTTLSIREQEI